MRLPASLNPAPGTLCRGIAASAAPEAAGYSGCVRTPSSCPRRAPATDSAALGALPLQPPQGRPRHAREGAQAGARARA